MAKKRFTDNLMGLFEEPAARPEVPTTPAEATVPATESTQPEESVEVKVPVKSSRAKRKLSSKGFTEDLDAFLSDSFEREAKGTGPAPADTPAPAHPPKTPRRRRKTGLDLLIRSTVSDEERSAPSKTAADTKRVTLIFKKDHLQTLKEQAKQRGVYLKDVVQEMVAEYLEK